MDNSTSASLSASSAQVTDDQKTVKPIPNRGGIPVAPVVTPPTPVSSPSGKEHEPAPFPDVSKMTGPEVVEEEGKIERELEALVEKTPDLEKPKIPEEAKKAGLEHAKADTPMPPVVSGVKPLPMSYDEAEFTRKKYKWKDSVAWFAAVVMYHWKKLGISNKKKEE
jgi:hypothetical protein